MFSERNHKEALGKNVLNKIKLKQKYLKYSFEKLTISAVFCCLNASTFFFKCLPHVLKTIHFLNQLLMTAFIYTPSFSKKS